MTAIPTNAAPPDLSPSAGISRPPTAADVVIDRGTRWLAKAFAAGTILLLLFIVYKIGAAATPALQHHGPRLVLSSNWDPNRGEYGLLAQILGTVYSSFIALVVATVLGVSIAIFLSQSFIPRRLEIVLKNIVELLAAVPSVVYGLWGIFVLVPLLERPANWLGDHLSWIPLFGGHLTSRGVLPASLVLAIMVLPTVSAISYDALTSVHPRLKEAAFGLGATRWETILKVVLPTASAGIFGSVVLAFGRALGETMALLMLMGSENNQFSISLFSKGNTLAALIASKYQEAQGNPTQTEVLLFAGMVLLAITLVVNVIGAGIIQFTSRNQKGARQ